MDASMDAVETLLRSVWFWIGLIVGCYCMSCLWLGELARFVPFVLLAAPSGLFHLAGIPGFENGFRVVDRVLSGHGGGPLALLLFVHAVFWSTLLVLVWKRKRLDRVHLLRLGFALVIVLVANLAGCTTMRYST
jgi:hypothetical protein